MDITISTQHTNLTPALEEAVREKFQRLQEHNEKSLQVHVVLRVDSGDHICEAVVTGLGMGKPLVSNCKHKDMYAAINEASHVIDRQWRKIKTAELAKRQRAVPLRRMS